MMSAIDYKQVPFKGHEDPYTAVDEKDKQPLSIVEVPALLAATMKRLYDHTSTFRVAPGLFATEYNNSQFRKLLVETSSAIVEHLTSRPGRFTVAYSLGQHDELVIELIHPIQRTKEFFYFQTWFH